MLRRLQRQQYPKSSFVFTSEHGTPLSQWWRGSARQPASTFRCTRINSAMLAAMRWPTAAPTRAPSKPISGTRTSSTPCVTPSWRRPVSATCGRTRALRTSRQAHRGLSSDIGRTATLLRAPPLSMLLPSRGRLAQPAGLHSLKLFVQVPDIRIYLPLSTDLFPNDHILANHLLWVVALSLKISIALFASCVGAE